MEVNNNMSDKKTKKVKADCFMAMGNICTRINAPNHAITYYTSAINLLEEQNRTKKLISCYKSRHKAYLQLKEEKKADSDLKLIVKAKLKRNIK